MLIRETLLIQEILPFHPLLIEYLLWLKLWVQILICFFHFFLKFLQLFLKLCKQTNKYLSPTTPLKKIHHKPNKKSNYKNTQSLLKSQQGTKPPTFPRKKTPQSKQYPQYCCTFTRDTLTCSWLQVSEKRQFWLLSKILKAFTTLVSYTSIFSLISFHLQHKYLVTFCPQNFLPQRKTDETEIAEINTDRVSNLWRNFQ